MYKNIHILASVKSNTSGSDYIVEAYIETSIIIIHMQYKYAHWNYPCAKYKQYIYVRTAVNDVQQSTSILSTNQMHYTQQ